MEYIVVVGCGYKVTFCATAPLTLAQNMIKAEWIENEQRKPNA
jgi:hypothetical protein